MEPNERWVNESFGISASIIKLRFHTVQQPKKVDGENRKTLAMNSIFGTELFMSHFICFPIPRFALVRVASSLSVSLLSPRFLRKLNLISFCRISGII